VWIKRRLQKEIFNKSIYWRPLAQEEIAELAPGQPVVIRQNYLYNPERRPVTYIEATFVEKVKRAGIFGSQVSEHLRPFGVLISFIGIDIGPGYLAFEYSYVRS
jgi:hypothetical protein